MTISLGFAVVLIYWFTILGGLFGFWLGRNINMEERHD